MCLERVFIIMCVCVCGGGGSGGVCVCYRAVIRENLSFVTVHASLQLPD